MKIRTGYKFKLVFDSDLEHDCLVETTDYLDDEQVIGRWMEEELNFVGDLYKFFRFEDIREITREIDDLKGPIYGVPWIESEFGQRDEGWSLFTDLDECIKSTRKSSDNGSYDGGYFGPVRPLCYYELPVEGLDCEYVEKLLRDGHAHTNEFWEPRFKSSGRRI